MDAVKQVARWIMRFTVLWGVDAVSLLVTAAIVPGVTFADHPGQGPVVVAAAAAFMLGLVNLLIRPAILLLTLPLGFSVTFAVGFFVNALTLLITSRLLPAFQVSGLLAAFAGGLGLSAVNTVITGVLTVNDDDSFYWGVVERLAKLQAFRGATEPGRGLVMMEIDGLSYWHMQKALRDGKLPTLKQMMEEEGYVLSRVDCGLPSQTSACQAGIMFGDNYDIPAFRWFDKGEQKLYVSGSDAPAINARYAKGNGLLRGGSSINNMMNGDAEKSLLTLADLHSGTDEEKSRRATDMYLLTVNPYFLMRTAVLMIGDALLEVFQYLKACVQNLQPRVDRLHHFYPLIRAATTVFMRDVAAHLASLDIIRGAPSIYVTWPGYDEVAHHSGPWSTDAYGVLKKYDRVVRYVRDLIRSKAPRPYELLILSDHGQSFGATFRQRYGLTLGEFIEQHLPQGTTVEQLIGGDTGVTSLAAVSGELDNIRQQGVGGRVGGSVVRQGQKAVGQAVARREETVGSLRSAQVVAYGSGNLAQVYFDLYPRRLLLGELDEAYPGIVNALVQHEGIGLVGGYADDGTPVALGKGGQRDLYSGQVTGYDPLKLYGNADLRAAQVRRVMDFPHSGDLMVISTVYADGTVAALEELIGSHGGMGGEQTDAFLFHPRDMVVPETSNSADLFHILNARRGSQVTVTHAQTETVPSEDVRPWAPANLVRGLAHHPSVWLGRALRALVLDRHAYREAARDPYMTAPALLIGLLGTLLVAVSTPGGITAAALLARLAVWPITVLLIYRAARRVGGKATYTTTLRGAGFGATTYLLSFLAFVPSLAPFARIVVVVVSFIATWIGAAEAQELRGWRTALLPVAGMLLFWFATLLAETLLAGAELTLQSLAQTLGLAP